mmetsp:Transcript_34669/g.136640  ORF Transcript_34669/g.136640 Transcript_34669/m.136640 type:complete len:117 (+) Transcript_34669:1412-1762(+)
MRRRASSMISFQRELPGSRGTRSLKERIWKRSASKRPSSVMATGEGAEAWVTAEAITVDQVNIGTPATEAISGRMDGTTRFRAMSTVALSKPLAKRTSKLPGALNKHIFCKAPTTC